MFGKRSDGKKAVGIDPIMRIMGTIMQHRYDAMVNHLIEIECDGLDKFIDDESKRGHNFSYMDIVIAALVRTYAERPALNRFVMNTRVFDKNKISISITIKKSLRDGADEAAIKLEFDGSESIYDVKEQIDRIVRENKGVETSNGAEKVSRMLLRCPPFLLKFIMRTLIFSDKHGMLPKKLIKVSPFHSSAYLTNLKSISTPYVYHHLYDFGTVGLFVALGKEVVKPVSDAKNNTVRNAKMLQLGITLDERICDGLYYARSLKMMKSHVSNPETLKEKYELQKPLTKKEQKKAKKRAKRERKTAKKESRRKAS